MRWWSCWPDRQTSCSQALDGMWPEMARVIGEFESLVETSWKTENLGQHEQTKHTQKAFLRDFQSLRDVIEEKANSFSDSSGDLLNLDSRDIADQTIVDTMRTLKNGTGPV